MKTDPKRKSCGGTGEMPQQLQASAALPENPISNSTLGGSQLPIN